MKMKKMKIIILFVLMAVSFSFLTMNTVRANEAGSSVSKNAAIISNLYFAKDTYTAKMGENGDKITVKALY